MRRHVLALIGAVALAAPMIATGTAQAADPPGAPQITAVVPGWARGEIVIDWNAPAVNPTGIVGYEVRISSDLGDNWAVPPVNTKSTVTEYTVTGLDPALSYVFEVRAYNAGSVNAPDGRGDWSDQWPNPVQPASNVGPPSYLVTTAQDRAVLVSWQGNDGAAAYQVQYGTSPTGPWSPSAPLRTVDEHKLVDGLTPGQNYYFQVRSYNGAQDYSDWIVTSSPVAPLGGPNAPTNVQAYAGNGTATVNWTAVSPAADSYDVQYRAGSGSWVSLNSTTSTTATANGLTNGVVYQFQVRANRGGTSSAWVASNSVVPVAPNVPSAPVSVSGYGTDSAAVISWTMQANQPVTTYLIQYSLNNSQWFPTTPISTGRVDLTYVLGGLANGQPYYIRVAAANGNLQSAFTQMPGTVTPQAVPGPPQYLTGVAGNNQVTLTWRPPNIVTPTSPITGYRVQYSLNGGATWMSAPDVTTPITTTVVGGLANGTGYIFRVRATSYSGDGAWSAVSSVITPPGGPTSPSSVAAVAGDSRATVSWVAPSNPTSSIVGYRVTAAPGGQTCTTSGVPPTTPATACVVTGLTNGQPYTFTVVAVTTSGTSAPSAPSAAVTPSGQSVSIRVTSSGRNGTQVFARGTTTGLTSGSTVTAMVRNKAGAAFRPAGQVAVQDDGTFSWSTNTGKKTWVRFMSGGVTSNTVIIGAK